MDEVERRDLSCTQDLEVVERDGCGKPEQLGDRRGGVAVVD